MKTSWIDLECPSCREQWESDPADLPAPGNEFECEHCGDRRPVSEFVKTAEGLEIHAAFHA